MRRFQDTNATIIARGDQHDRGTVVRNGQICAYGLPRIYVRAMRLASALFFHLRRKRHEKPTLTGTTLTAEPASSAASWLLPCSMASWGSLAAG